MRRTNERIPWFGGILGFFLEKTICMRTIPCSTQHIDNLNHFNFLAVNILVYKFLVSRSSRWLDSLHRYTRILDFKRSCSHIAHGSVNTVYDTVYRKISCKSTHNPTSGDIIRCLNCLCWRFFVDNKVVLNANIFPSRTKD